MTTVTKDIPDAVLDILEVVRSGGETNMMARNAVIRLALEHADDEGTATQYAAVMWLTDNDGRYMEALNAMGARSTG